MIRFSAALVVVAIGVLIGGVATSKLTLIYIAIAISAAALVTLAVGVALKREELFGEGRALSPAEAGGSVGLPVSAAAEHDRHDQVQRGGSAAPHLEPFPGLAAAPLGQPLFGAAVISSDSGRPDGPARTAFGPPVPGQPAFGPPAFGQNPATNPWPTADNPWPTADAAVASGWSGAEPSAPATPRAGDLGRPPWDVSGGERGGQPDWDRQAGPVSGWQPDAGTSAPARDTTQDRPGQDWSGQEGGGRPSLPGRHSRNAGAGAAWPPFPAADPAAEPEPSTPPPPFASSPRRVPGATLGPWFDEQAEPYPQAASPETAPEPETTSEPTATSGTAWSGTSWSSWSSPSTASADDPAPPADAATRVEPAMPAAAITPEASGSPGDDDDDWPTRYSWLDDDGTDKPEEPDTPAGADTDAKTSTGPELTTDPELSEVAPRDDASADADAAEPLTTTAVPAEPAGSGSLSDISATDVTDETDELPASGAVGEPSAVAEAAGASATATATDTATDTADAMDADTTGADTTSTDTTSTDTTEAGSEDEGATGGEPSAPTATGPRLVTVVPGVPRYHDANCILIRFMPENDVQSMTVPEAKKLGTPCAACQPED